MMSGQIPRQCKAMFLSHGGGPLPVLGDAGHREMVAHLREVASTIRRPAAIIVVSAHWEEPVVTITANPQPSIMYDYYGFPPEAYELQYPAPGDPALASALQSALQQQGVAAELDGERGFDHGLFIPLLLMYPDADIPCVQLSLLAGLDPAAHIRIGEAIAALDQPDVLVLGSGFSFHNLKVLLGGNARRDDPDNDAFEAWLIDTCRSAALNEDARRERLIYWDSAPGARHCHPREEHLLPLHVCYGVGGRAAAAHAELEIMKRRSSTYFW